MPQIQTIERQPSPLEKIMPYLNQAMGDIASGITKRQEYKLSQQATKTLSDPNATHIQKASAFSDAPEAYKKYTGPVWASILGPQAEMAAYNEYVKSQGGGSSAPPTQSQTPEIPGQAASPNQQPSQQSPPAPQFIQGVEGYQFTPEEIKVLTPPIKIPAVGFLKGEAQAQNQQNAAAKKALSKYIAPDIKAQSSLKVRRSGLERAEQLFSTGKAGLNAQNIFSSLAKDLKFPGSNALASALKTTESKEVETIMRDQLAGVKDFGGSRPSQMEVLIQKDALPNFLDSSADANAKIKVLQSTTEYNIKKNELISKLSSKNPYMSPQDLENLVEAKMAPMAAQLLNSTAPPGGEYLISPNTGIPTLVPKDKVEALIQKGGKRIQ